MTASRHRPTARRLAALATGISLVASACMFQGDDDQSVSSNALGPRPVESGLPDDPKPVRGGQLVYGLEAETASGFCLPEAQMAASGIQVARALYDPLTIPDGKGGYVPYLAKTVDHDDSYKVWTLTLRSGITFHDGSKLDATVVKNNLDAYRGAYEARASLLFAFTLNNITKVDVVNELTVRVTTEVPWVAFPAALYSSGRFGMVAQAQLDAPKERCSEVPIGTGPFRFVSWTKDVSLKVRRNDTYWQQAPDGKPFPYLDAIDFRPMPNSDARVVALQSGELNMLHTSSATDMANTLDQLRADGAINLLVSVERTETSYLLINAKHEALAKREVRLALAHAIDKERLNELANSGFSPLADGPFAPEVLGFLDDPGAPEFDLAAAKKEVKALKEQGVTTSFGLMTSVSPSAVRLAGVLKEMLEEAGFTIAVDAVAEGDVIQRAISGEYDISAFRNQPGEDPDSNHTWWNGGGNPVNFGRFDDPVINENLRIGRSTADSEVRRKAYEAINKQFAKEAWNIYLSYAPWAVAESSNVHGILGPDLPDGAGEPSGRLATGHAVHGIWIDPS